MASSLPRAPSGEMYIHAAKAKAAAMGTNQRRIFCIFCLVDWVSIAFIIWGMRWDCKKDDNSAMQSQQIKKVEVYTSTFNFQPVTFNVIFQIRIDRSCRTTHRRQGSRHLCACHRSCPSGWHSCFSNQFPGSLLRVPCGRSRRSFRQIKYCR